MIKAVLGCSAAVAVFAASPAMAAYIGYSDYALYTYQRNNYTGAHTKASSDQFIRNNVTSYTSTSSADFWGCDVNQNQITPDYHQKVGSTSDLTFDSTHQQKAGNQVVMGMQNDDYNYTTTAYVTGQVDFR